MTYLAPTVADPATNPWDTEAVVAQALDVLRLDPADMDAERIAIKAAEAVALIDEYLDLIEPYATAEEIPAPVVGAAVTVTIEGYRSKDAVFGLIDSWSADGSFARVSPDRLKGVRSTLRPFKRRFGMF